MVMVSYTRIRAKLSRECGCMDLWLKKLAKVVIIHRLRWENRVMSIIYLASNLVRDRNAIL